MALCNLSHKLLKGKYDIVPSINKSDEQEIISNHSLTDSSIELDNHKELNFCSANNFSNTSDFQFLRSSYKNTSLLHQPYAVYNNGTKVYLENFLTNKKKPNFHSKLLNNDLKLYWIMYGKQKRKIGSLARSSELFSDMSSKNTQSYNTTKPIIEEKLLGTEISRWTLQENDLDESFSDSEYSIYNPNFEFNDEIQSCSENSLNYQDEIRKTHGNNKKMKSKFATYDSYKISISEKKKQNVKSDYSKKTNDTYNNILYKTQDRNNVTKLILDTGNKCISKAKKSKPKKLMKIQDVYLRTLVKRISIDNKIVNKELNNKTQVINKLAINMNPSIQKIKYPQRILSSKIELPSVRIVQSDLSPLSQENTYAEFINDTSTPKNMNSPLKSQSSRQNNLWKSIKIHCQTTRITNKKSNKINS